MDAPLDFQNALADSLEKRRAWLDSNVMPKLKDEYRLFNSSYAGLYNLMLKKGVIHEDPYKHDAKIGDIKVPAEGPFSESERIDQMSIRLSEYESQLDFLINFYQFSVENLSMERLRQLLSLTKYFTWMELSSGSPNINTRTLVDLLAMVKAGNDSLSTGILAEAVGQLERSSKAIFPLLKQVSDYQRENYKLELRLRVLNSLKFDPSTVITHKDETLRQVRRKFSEAMAERHFYPELVEEVLLEDYAGDGPNQKEALLKRLAIPETKQREAKQTVSFRAILMDGIRILAGLSFTLNDTLTKIQENSALLEGAKNSFGEKVRRVIRQVFNMEAEELIYEIDYQDIVTGISKSEKLPFKSFCDDLDRKARLLGALATKGSAPMKRLEAATDEQILATLSKNIEEIQSIHKTLTALDNFFKSEAPKEMRERMRGIKPELSGIKNNIVKANQKRHEYLSEKEELDQMKRLGIRGEGV